MFDFYRRFRNHLTEYFSEDTKIIAESEAIEIAKQIVVDQEWSWFEPIDATKTDIGSKLVWEVRTNAMARGCNARIVIDAKTREVLTKGFLPR